VRVWDVSAAAERPPFQPFRGEVRALAFLAGGKVLAVAGTEKSTDGRDLHAVKLWDMAGGKVRDTLTLAGAVNALAAATDGKTLAIGFEGGLRLRDTETNQDKTLAIGFDAKVRLLDTETKQDEPALRLKVERVFFAPDGTAVAISSRREGVVFWDLTTRSNRGAVFPGPLTTAVALSPDGKRLALVTRDYRLKVWDVKPARARLLLDQHRGRITALAFSPDGRLLVSGSQDQTVRLWQLE
jgi:WD40 repeat protein